MACIIDSCVPTHSRTESAPTPFVSCLMRSTPSSPRSVTVSVAPNSRASCCRDACRLMAMTRSAPICFADNTPSNPTAPRDVLGHQCIRFRHRGESVYKWELDKGDESLTIAVHGSLLLDDVDLVIHAAREGAGLAWVTEDRIAEHLESGALIRVLEEWCPAFPGFFLYYPTRKQRSEERRVGKEC